MSFVEVEHQTVFHEKFKAGIPFLLYKFCKSKGYAWEIIARFDTRFKTQDQKVFGISGTRKDFVVVLESRCNLIWQYLAFDKYDNEAPFETHVLVGR